MSNHPEFNPDGSINIETTKEKAVDADNLTAGDTVEFNTSPVVRIVRRAVSSSPLIDELDIFCSPHIQNPERVVSIYNEARGTIDHMAQLSIAQKGPGIYVVRIVSGQFRDDFVMGFKKLLAEKLPAKIQYYGSENDYRKGIQSGSGRNKRLMSGLKKSGLL